MQFLSSLSARTKLLTSFLMVCLLLGSVSIFALTRIGSTNATIVNMYENQLLPITALGKSSQIQTELGRTGARSLLTSEIAAKKECLADIELLIKNFHLQYDAIVIPQATTAEEKAMTVRVLDLFSKYADQTTAVVQHSINGNDEAAKELLKQVLIIGQDLQAVFEEEFAFNEGLALDGLKASQSTYESTYWLVIASISVGSALGLGIGWWIARWFTVALLEVSAIADHVSAASQQLAAASEELSSGAQEQASSLEETASSLEEITSTIQQNADNAQQANQLAGNSRRVAENGGEVVGKAVQGMSEINSASKRISDIITAIDEIAFQTNLLALNAAVEAARAGEQGRGFAVVAGEVRNLAQRSAAAAKEIKSLIQDSVGKVQTGSELVNKSGVTLSDIVTSVKRVSDIVSEIAAASREQASGIEQVTRAVTQMDQVVQSNAAQTEELTSTAESLAGQAIQLQQLVSQFNLVKKNSSNKIGALSTQSASTVRVANRATTSRKSFTKKPSSTPRPEDSLESDVEQQLEQLCASGAPSGFESF